MLAAAGLAEADLEPNPTPFVPPFFADRRASWRGTTAQRPDLPLEVRMASLGHRLVYFRLLPVSPEDEAAAAENADDGAPSWFASLVDEWFEWWQLLVVIGILGAIPLMRGNVRRGRGDLRGARRLATFVLSVHALLWVVRGPHFVNITTEWALAQLAIGKALWQAVLVWIFYLALEPYVRRTWPHSLISWTRLLSGRFRDPLVGRSLLVGGLFGAFWTLIGHVDVLLPGWLGLSYEPDPVDPWLFDSAISASASLAATGEFILSAVFDGVFSMLFLVLFRLLLRRRDLAVGAYILVVGMLYAPAGAHPHISWLTVGLLVALTEALAIVRFGLLTFVAAVFVFSLLSFFPLTLDMTAWYAGSGLLGPALVLLLTATSCFYALAPRRRREPPTDLSRYSS